MLITKTFLLENLCCENCAAAIEVSVAALPGVTAAKIDYEAKTVTITADCDADLIFPSIVSIVADIDEDVAVKEA
ncbi:MAG: heavy-metal-associated domain-containing protein [Clostridiales bacterium]|jgi:Cd2+/Zn2+-exporting ATPase|nr:heavy-metal-associated domain-containing protein [Clostridiales bacterium]